MSWAVAKRITIAVANVADLFAGLSDGDIRAAAQHPDGLFSYLAHGPGRNLLDHTEEALTPFAAQLMTAGADVFAKLAPRSGRFAPTALVRLLNQVESALAGVNDVRLQITVARDELLASQHRVVERVEALHPKVDEILRHVQKPDVWPGESEVSVARVGQGPVPPIPSGIQARAEDRPGWTPLNGHRRGASVRQIKAAWCNILPAMAASEKTQMAASIYRSATPGSRHGSRRRASTRYLRVMPNSPSDWV